MPPERDSLMLLLPLALFMDGPVPPSATLHPNPNPPLAPRLHYRSLSSALPHKNQLLFEVWERLLDRRLKLQ